MARRIESHRIPGPAGFLEALVEAPEGMAPREVAVACHPHPRYGGTMHNKVVYRLSRGLLRSGSVVARFNFRGVGLSEGEYAGGIGEVEDAVAALEWIRSRNPGLPFSLAGFSFGARVVLKLGCRLPDTSRLIALGLPTRGGDWGHLARCPAPKHFIQSTRDEYGPRAELEQIFEGFAPPKRIIWVEAHDHFFKGALDRLEEVVAGL